MNAAQPYRGSADVQVKSAAVVNSSAVIAAS